MALKGPDLEKLAEELLVDPLQRDYDAMDDVEAADSLNFPDRIIPPETVDAAYLMPQLTVLDIKNLSGEAWQWLTGILYAQPPIPNSDTVQAELAAMFPNSAFLQPGSRGVEITILPTILPADVSKARKINEDNAKKQKGK